VYNGYPSWSTHRCTRLLHGLAPHHPVLTSLHPTLNSASPGLVGLCSLAPVPPLPPDPLRRLCAVYYLELLPSEHYAPGQHWLRPLPGPSSLALRLLPRPSRCRQLSCQWLRCTLRQIFHRSHSGVPAQPLLPWQPASARVEYLLACFAPLPGPLSALPERSDGVQGVHLPGRLSIVPPTWTCCVQSHQADVARMQLVPCQP